MLLEEVSVTGSFGFFSGGGLSFSGSELEEEEVAESSGEALRFLCGGNNIQYEICRSVHRPVRTAPPR